MTEKMTPEERARYDAKAEAEAWDLATRILQPWVQATREIGHPELTRVMEHAFEEAEREYRRAGPGRSRAPRAERDAVVNQPGRGPLAGSGLLFNVRPIRVGCKNRH